MNIGIDIDGVILDSERKMAFYAEYYARYVVHKQKIRDDSIAAEVNYNFSQQETDAFYLKYFDMITQTCDFVPLAQEFLKKLEDDGNNLYILTARGSYNDREVKYCKPRLAELGIKFKEVVWGLKDKSEACEKLNLDFMIEDNPAHIQKILRTQTKVIQLKDPSSTLPNVDNPNVCIAKNWIEIYDIINMKPFSDV